MWHILPMPSPRLSRVAIEISKAITASLCQPVMRCGGIESLSLFLPRLQGPSRYASAKNLEAKIASLRCNQSWEGKHDGSLDRSFLPRLDIVPRPSLARSIEVKLAPPIATWRERTPRGSKHGSDSRLCREHPNRVYQAGPALA